PASVFGLKEGDVHVIRNAGGCAPEALRSLVISEQLLNTDNVIVAQHTDCGMLTFENQDTYSIIHKNLGVDATHINFLPFPQNVRDDMAFLRNNPLIPKSVNIYDYVYDVATGHLIFIDLENSETFIFFFIFYFLFFQNF
ncbi:carbonic anhydrase, partial [Lobosporangium transversale]